MLDMEFSGSGPSASYYQRRAKDAEAQLAASEARVASLEDEVERLREGLAFYAEVREYNRVGGDPVGTPPPIMNDKGRRARALLAQPAAVGVEGR